MQSLSKIPVLTVSNFNNFKRGDLFKRPKIEDIFIFLGYSETNDTVTMLTVGLDAIIKNIKDKPGLEIQSSSMFRVQEGHLICMG